MEQPMLYEGLKPKQFRKKREVLRRRTIKDDGEPIMVPKKVLACKQCGGQMTVCKGWESYDWKRPVQPGKPPFGAVRTSGNGWRVACEFHDYKTTPHRPMNLLEYMEATGLVREWLIKYVKVKER